MSGGLRDAPGFTLIELIVALSISTFILAGIVGVASQMVRFQMEGKNKGDVTGWTLMSLMKMHQELEDATVLDFPSPGTPTGNYISGCSNYSRVISPPGRIDTTADIVAFWYCVPAGGARANNLLRYESRGPFAACPRAPPNCGFTGGYQVYAQDFYRADGLTYFFRRASDAGIEVNYIVGIATPSADPQMPKPVYMKVRNKIGMNKSYNNPID